MAFSKAREAGDRRAAIDSHPNKLILQPESLKPRPELVKLRPKFRTERGLSQDKIAEDASLYRTYVSGIERGVRNPGIKVVIRVALCGRSSADTALHFPQNIQHAEICKASHESSTSKVARVSEKARRG